MFPCLTFYSRYLGQILSEVSPLHFSFCELTIPAIIGITPQLKLIAAHLLCIESLSSCLRAAIVHRIFDSVEANINLHCNDGYIYQPLCDLHHLRTSVLPLEMIVCRVGATPKNSAKPGWIRRGMTGFGCCLRCRETVSRNIWNVPDYLVSCISCSIHIS